MSQSSSRRPTRALTVSVLVLWFLLILLGSLLGVFKGNPSQPPMLLGLAVVLPVLVFVVAWYGSTSMQRLVVSVNLRTITRLQSGRVFGVVFLTLYVLGALPGIFALPAGLGDVAIGLTAPFVASLLASKARERPGPLAAWNVLGMLDLVMAVSLGILTSRSSLGLLAGGTTSAVVVAFPLSLIPTFLVPFYFILHLISLHRVRRIWEQRREQGLMSKEMA